MSRRIYRKRLEYLAAGELSRRIDSLLAEPTEAGVRTYYEEHRTQFREPVKVDLRAILVTGGEQIAATERIGEIRARIESGELTFGEAASRFSDHPSALDDGALRWREQRRLLAFGVNVLQAVQAAGVGELIGPVQEAGGFWLFLLLGRTDARLLSLEEAGPRVRERMLNATRRQLLSVVRARLAEEMQVRLVTDRP